MEAGHFETDTPERCGLLVTLFRQMMTGSEREIGERQLVPFPRCRTGGSPDEHRFRRDDQFRYPSVMGVLHGHL